MLQLFIFLILALIVYYVVKPEKPNQIWLSAIFIPLCGIIAYSLVAYLYFANFANTNIALSYLTGGATGKCLIPAIISGVVIFFLLKRKKKNENITKFPLILAIFIGISLIGAIVTAVLEYRNEKFVREHYSELMKITNNYNDTQVFNNQPEEIETYSINKAQDNSLQNQVATKQFNAQEVSFSYPASWDIDKQNIEDIGFLVYCMNPSGYEGVMVIYGQTRMQYTAKESLENTINKVSKNWDAEGVEYHIGRTFNSSYGKYNCVRCEVVCQLNEGEMHFSNFSFIRNDKNVHINRMKLKEANTDNLDIIENSFTIKSIQ